jgi:hypothetical protein
MNEGDQWMDKKELNCCGNHEGMDGRTYDQTLRVSLWMEKMLRMVSFIGHSHR